MLAVGHTASGSGSNLSSTKQKCTAVIEVVVLTVIMIVVVRSTKLTLVAAVFKLGVVVVLVCDEDGDLTDPDQRLLGLICGRHRQRELPLTLPVETHRRGDHT